MKRFGTVRRGLVWLWAIFVILGSSIAILALAVWLAKWLQYFYCGNLSDRSQTAGAVLAIVAGFAATVMQLDRQKNEARAIEADAGRAALQLAHDTLDAVTDRLNAALAPPDQTVEFALRGVRTGEFVEAMREFDTGRLPSAVLADFIRLRSLMTAINERLNDVYKAPRRRSTKTSETADRNDRLESAVKARNDAVKIYGNLQTAAMSRYAADDMPLALYNRVENYSKRAVTA